ncbi:MAG TPA: aminoglycoside phosphotransferase family protein [Devosiaceae bacterium]|jgi:aminoglycoside phosphotransferase (APT) family kinase protein
MSLPDESLAMAIAQKHCGDRPLAARRFTTGTRHYVYEVSFPNDTSVVVRIGDRNAHREMEGAVHLSGLLRPLGVPLPKLLAHELATPLPWMLLERLQGHDLWDFIATMPDLALKDVARAVARAQAIAATTPSAGRFGYAAHADKAPHASWREVLKDNLDRSRRRITSAGLFDAALVERVEVLLADRADQIDGIAATPFLHDTTTKNVIVTSEGRYSGIVDVDDLCFGDPRYAAALTLAVLQAYGGPVAYVDYWLAAADEKDDALFRLYVALFLLDLMGNHGQVFNGNQRPSQPKERARLLAAFEESLKQVGQAAS